MDRCQSRDDNNNNKAQRAATAIDRHGDTFRGSNKAATTTTTAAATSSTTKVKFFVFAGRVNLMEFGQKTRAARKGAGPWADGGV